MAADKRVPRNPYNFTREDYDDLVQQVPSCHVSARSKYHEIELVEDCTLFEMYRQPRVPVGDRKATKTLSMRQLNADLTCPICLGIIKETMVVMECLHRFCRACISTAIRHSKRECPSCRIHIPSKRSLRPDVTFDAFIATVHPNLEAFERHEDEIIEQVNRARRCHAVQSNLDGDTTSTDEGTAAAAAGYPPVSRRQSGRIHGEDAVNLSRPSSPVYGEGPLVGEKRHSPAGGSPHANGLLSAAVSKDEGPAARKKLRNASRSSTLMSAVASERVNLRVLLHDDEQMRLPMLERTVFTTSSKLKVRHLKKHLATLLKLDTYDRLCIVLPTVNCTLSGLSELAKKRKSGGGGIRQDLLCDQELEDFVTIRDIYQQYGMSTDWELRLLYHFSSGTIINGIARFVPATSCTT
uniref:RING-type E3 ubiquitin transferase n=1 Tax=Hyaloperonospora arabidopsidis (strain Emoy2) TaxID=559515 RepID=M4BE16_HYAAE